MALTPGRRPIHVAVANDFELIVAGLREMLRPFADRVQVDDALVVGRPVRTPVEVVLFDTFGRADDGLVAIKQLLADENVGKVAIYTAYPRQEASDAAIAAGASAVLSKSRDGEDLVRGLEMVTQGIQVVDSSGGAPVPSFPGASVGLTPRQAEVLALVLQGLRNTEIAEALYIDVNTVKTHLRHAYRTLQVRSRAHAVAVLLGDGTGFNRTTSAN